jgi:O-Antigen ligase
LLASVLIARDRGRYSLTLLAIVMPVAATAPRLIGDAAPSATLVRERGMAALTAAVVAAVIVCLVSMLDRRGRFPFGGREGRIALALWAAAIGLAACAFVVTTGRPDTWAAARWNEFTDVNATAAAPSDAAHFGTGASNRYDYWRVAWRTFEDDPIQGVGAGAFSVPWFKARALDENVTDAHSWEASALAETGLVGFALAAFVLLFPLARLRSARKGTGPWPIAAVALGGAAVYFVLHASVDWLFRIPAVAIPGFVLLGALASGGDEHGGPVFGDRAQRALLALAALVALAVAVPTYLATAGVADAESNAATSTPAALSDLDRAERLNPFAAEPLLVRALVLKADGRPNAALAAAENATDRAPQSWTAWLLLADGRRLTGNTLGSRAALARAAALNPRAIRQLGLSQ